jgi:hypothetical protein
MHRRADIAARTIHFLFRQSLHYSTRPLHGFRSEPDFLSASQARTQGKQRALALCFMYMSDFILRSRTLTLTTSSSPSSPSSARQHAKEPQNTKPLDAGFYLAQRKSQFLMPKEKLPFVAGAARREGWYITFGKVERGDVEEHRRRKAHMMYVVAMPKSRSKRKTRSSEWVIAGEAEL